jgi:hypothetical protein
MSKEIGLRQRTGLRLASVTLPPWCRQKSAEAFHFHFRINGLHSEGNFSYLCLSFLKP